MQDTAQRADIEVTGVHPYADKFPMLPDSGERFVGTSSQTMTLVTINESAEHPGFFDVSVTHGDEHLKLSRPVQGSDCGIELIQRFIQEHTEQASLTWKREPHTPHAPILDKSRVYFIADEDGYIKIGVATDVSSRLKTLQTASRQELRIIATVPGDASIERELHAQFADARVRGEWFAPTPDLLRLIEEVTS